MSGITNIIPEMTGAASRAAFNNNFAIMPTIYNVEDYGAVHDNSTDDTEAIQAAINACFAAGGGVVFFPKGIYLIAGDLQTDINGINYNSQIYIPYINSTGNRNAIRLQGEIPHTYSLIFNEEANGVILHSTIVGSGTLPAVIGGSGQTNINYTRIEIENIVVAVDPFLDSGGPSMSGVNFRLISHLRIKSLMCTIAIEDKTLLVKPENHVFGLLVGAKNGDFPQIDFYVGIGFYYGIGLGEGVHVLNMLCYFNYIGMMSWIPNYGTVIEYAILHWNAYDIAALQETIGLLGAGTTSNIIINHLASEDKDERGPAWTNRVDEILDEDNCLQGRMDYYIAGDGGVGAGENIVKSHGGNNLLVRNVADPSTAYHWATTERPISPKRGTQGYNTTTDKLEAWDGTQWNDLY